MHVPLGGESPGAEAARREKRERKPAKIPPGTIVAAKVTNVHATHAGVELESGEHAVLYSNLDVAVPFCCSANPALSLRAMHVPFLDCMWA